MFKRFQKNQELSDVAQYEQESACAAWRKAIWAAAICCADQARCGRCGINFL